jgi:hypothetical protein
MLELTAKHRWLSRLTAGCVFQWVNSSRSLPVTPSAWKNDPPMTSDTLLTVVEEKIGKVWGFETFLIMIFQDGNVGLIDTI